jgi:hypothetical protein
VVVSHYVHTTCGIWVHALFHTQHQIHTTHNAYFTGKTLHDTQHPGFDSTDPHLPPTAKLGVEFGVISVDTERAKVVKLRLRSNEFDACLPDDCRRELGGCHAQK